MAFLSRVTPAKSEKVDLPVTPMLDMTFQLLSFFLLTFTPQSAVEGKMEFSLPTQAGNGPGAPEPLPPIDQPPTDVPEKMTVVVRTGGAGQGNISALILETDAGPTALRDLANLREQLRTRRAEAANTQVRIAADSQLKYACLMDVMDVCLEAGFPNVGFVAPPDLVR